MLREIATLKRTSVYALIDTLTARTIGFEGTETWRAVYEQLLAKWSVQDYRSVAVVTGVPTSMLRSWVFPRLLMQGHQPTQIGANPVIKTKKWRLWLCAVSWKREGPWVTTASGVPSQGSEVATSVLLVVSSGLPDTPGRHTVRAWRAHPPCDARYFSVSSLSAPH